MLQKALPYSLLLAAALVISPAQAEEAQPLPQIANSDASSKLARINPMFAARHKGCPMLQEEGRMMEDHGEPCPHHAAHHGAGGEPCNHEAHK